MRTPVKVPKVTHVALNWPIDNGPGYPLVQSLCCGPWGSPSRLPLQVGSKVKTYYKQDRTATNSLEIMDWGSKAWGVIRSFQSHCTEQQLSHATAGKIHSLMFGLWLMYLNTQHKVLAAKHVKCAYVEWCLPIYSYARILAVFGE